MPDTSTFVVATGHVDLGDHLTIEVGDVGIMESQSSASAKVFFIRVWQSVELPLSSFSVFAVEETGDAFPTKICNVCHRLLATADFDKNQTGVNNRVVRRPTCKNCRIMLDGIRMKPKEKTAWLKKKPALTPFECPICNKRTIAGVTSKVVLDHNHLTGDPRAWICDSCNTGIGRFKDDVALLQKAIAFLQPD